MLLVGGAGDSNSAGCINDGDTDGDGDGGGDTATAVPGNVGAATINAAAAVSFVSAAMSDGTCANAEYG